MYTDEVVVK